MSSFSMLRSVGRGGRISAALGLGFAMLCPTLVQADHLVAKGMSMTGSVKEVTSAGVGFQPDFAKDGSLLIPWENVEELTTDSNYQLLYGDGMEVLAPIEGFRDGRLVVGDASVEPAEIVTAVALAGDSPGLMERIRSNWRYWHGGVDLGFNLQQATTDNLGFLFAVNALRAKDATRLILGMDYRYGNQRNPSNPPPRKQRTNDSVSALIRGEYDVAERVFLYGSTDALYDAVQNLSLRAVPKAGAGYVVWQREPSEGVRDFFQVEAGVGWVYEKYIHNGNAPDPVVPDNDYVTVALGAAAAYALPRGASFDWRFDYLPSVSDFAEDYVIRTAAGLTVPLIAPVSARLAVVDTFDNTPSGDAQKNSLNVDTSLGLDW